MSVPIALLAIPLVRRFVKPDRPPQPCATNRLDRVTVFVVWVVSLTFVSGWYRKWGGWTSNTFAAMMLLILGLPPALIAWGARDRRWATIFAGCFEFAAMCWRCACGC